MRGPGWLRWAIGIYLVGLVGAITYNLAPLLLTSARGARFTGASEQEQLVLGMFGLVIALGLGSILNGLWQWKTGRRNQWLYITMVALGVLLVVLVMLCCGGRKSRRRRLRLNSGAAAFREQITVGRGECADQGRVVIERLNGRQIAYRLYQKGSADVSASAILNRKK
jgi:MFS family permease